MNRATRVLVVDDLTETTDVLRAVLEPRGMTVERAPRTAAEGPGPRAAPPAVIVVDAESAACRGLSTASWPRVPKVVVGTFPAARLDGATDDGAGLRQLSKPFHYAELLRAIESLIAERAA